jgi:thiamine transport system substrate-binding protein
MNRSFLALVCCGLFPAGCASTAPPVETKPTELTLVAYDSFSFEASAFAAFTTSTGIAVKIVHAGDAGTMLSKAQLTAGNPEGDVMWGVDNTLLARAVDAKVFSPYTSTEGANLNSDAVALAVSGLVTPVDEGDVCLNYDVAWFADQQVSVPTTLDDLIKPEYKDLLVVENPATSSTGLAFLLATIAKFGDDGWSTYWSALRTNGVSVVDSWDQAYYEQFSGSSGKGPRPLVVSYASSPPAEVIFSDPRPVTAPTGVITATCFHQVEFAGVLRGSKFPKAAGELIDFLVSKGFQETLPLTLFVNPARTDAALPPEFVEFSTVIESPLTMSPVEIQAGSKEWIAAWTDLMVR